MCLYRVVQGPLYTVQGGSGTIVFFLLHLKLLNCAKLITIVVVKNKTKNYFEYCYFYIVFKNLSQPPCKVSVEWGS